jgi:hypothetical protein
MDVLVAACELCFDSALIARKAGSYSLLFRGSQIRHVSSRQHGQRTSPVPIRGITQ